jgi:hypothetical protein
VYPRFGSLVFVVAAAAAAVLVVPRYSQAAALTGRIRAGADVAAPPPLSVAVDAWACAAGGTVEDPRLRIGAERGLADVVVRITSADGAPPYPASGEVLLDQTKCVFRPHVVVVAPGQDLRVRNGDPILHNFRTSGAANKAVNRAQVKGKEDVLGFATPEIIVAECDVHYWMSAVVVVAPHAWTAVTGEDGTFEIDGVPAGEHTVELWHQTLGTRTERVTVGNGAAPLDVEWGAAPTPKP